LIKFFVIWKYVFFSFCPHRWHRANARGFLNCEHLQKVNQRLVDAPRQLKGKRLVIGGCWRKN